MNRTEWALVAVALVGCRADEPSDHVLGAERATGVVTAANPSAPESSPASTAPEGPGQDHGTRADPPGDAEVCVDEDARSTSEVCEGVHEVEVPSNEPAQRHRGDASAGHHGDAPEAPRGWGASSER